MKQIFITALILFFVAKSNAQQCAPNQLTCTEEAFNFSISLGSKWKLGTPKMGPAEILRTEPNYVPGWFFKDRQTVPDAHLQPWFEMAFGTRSLGYAVNKQNYVSSNTPYNLKIVDRLKNLLPNRPLVWMPYQRAFEFNQGGKNHL